MFFFLLKSLPRHKFFFKERKFFLLSKSSPWHKSSLSQQWTTLSGEGCKTRFTPSHPLLSLLTSGYLLSLLTSDNLLSLLTSNYLLSLLTSNHLLSLFKSYYLFSLLTSDNFLSLSTNNHLPSLQSNYLFSLLTSNPAQYLFSYIWQTDAKVSNSQQLERKTELNFKENGKLSGKIISPAAHHLKVWNSKQSSAQQILVFWLWSILMGISDFQIYFLDLIRVKVDCSCNSWRNVDLVGNGVSWSHLANSKILKGLIYLKEYCVA